MEEETRKKQELEKKKVEEEKQSQDSKAVATPSPEPLGKLEELTGDYPSVIKQVEDYVPNLPESLRASYSAPSALIKELQAFPRFFAFKRDGQITALLIYSYLTHHEKHEKVMIHHLS